MMRTPQPDRFESADDPPGRDHCSLLDEYWHALRDGSKPHLVRPADPNPPDNSVAAELEVLNLLYWARQMKLTGDEVSDASARWLSEPSAMDRGEGGEQTGVIAHAPRKDGPEAPEVPERIGKYLVVELLDRGGQAQVFRVIHPKLAKECILKLTRRPTSSDDEPDREVMLREGRLLAHCDHPNLVRVLDLDVHEGRWFFVMDYFPALNLEQYVAREHPGPRRAAALVIELARAVAYLHGRGITHQDVKPKNILVDDQGRPRLIDLGTARQNHAWRDDTDDWTSGTAAYSSPEQANGFADLIGPWTDVFGLGAVLYYLLTGRPLYLASSRAATIQLARKADYIPVGQLNPRVSRSLERICRKALEADPERRCPSALALERALRRSLSGRLVTATVLASLLTVGAASMIFRWPGPQRPKSGHTSGPLPEPIVAVTTPLTVVEFGGELYRKRLGANDLELGSIELSARPILEGDGVSVMCTLNAPAYSYIIALTPDGKNQLYWPRAETMLPSRSAQIGTGKFGFCLNEGPGLQAFVVLASTNPLPPFRDWAAREGIRRHWKPAPSDDVDGIWEYRDGKFRSISATSRGPVEDRGRSQLTPFRAVCAYLANLPDLAAVRGFAFGVKPKGGANAVDHPRPAGSHRPATNLDTQGKELAPAPKSPSQLLLQGEDAERAGDLGKAVEVSLKADHWAEAIAKSEELRSLRSRLQGAKHYETATEEWRLRALRRVAPMPHDDRAAYLLAIELNDQAEGLAVRWGHIEAEPLFEKALEIRRRLLTDDHPQTAESYDNLASNLRRLLTDVPHNSESRDALARTFRRLLRESQPQTTETYDQLADKLLAQGKYAPAQPFFDKALKIRQALLTDDHPDTAESYSNAALNLYGQGEYAVAKPLFEKALEINRRLLTDDHPATAESYDDLASNLLRLGKYAGAQPLFETALKIYRRLLGEDHPRTAEAYDSVAINLHARGRYAEAQPLHDKALEIRHLLLTDAEPATAVSYQNVASNLQAQGKLTVAEPLLRKALEINRRAMTDDHILTATSFNLLAANLRDQGKFAEAHPLFQKALQIKLQVLGGDHPETGICYNNVATNLEAQKEYSKAQPFFDKALQIYHRRFADDHPLTGRGYNDVATNLDAQGMYAQAQLLFEKALKIRRRILGDDHPDTASTYNNLAANLHAQGEYAQALDRWLSAAKSLDTARLRIAFDGLERAGRVNSPRAALAAVQARLGQPGEAWLTLEQDLGRGLLDELAERRDERLTPPERDELRELMGRLERLDRLAESSPDGLDQAERARRFDDLRHRRALASIELGELQTKLARKYGELKGQVATLEAIQVALPADAALIAWVDIPSLGPHAADPDGEHWGVVVRSHGVPRWIPMRGSGADGLWTEDDTTLAGRLRTDLRRRPDDRSANQRALIKRLRIQRLAPLAVALGASRADGLPAARNLIVLPSHHMAGIPVETLLDDGDTRTVSYAPSATVLKHLRQSPRPNRDAGLLAIGDPAYLRSDKSSEPEPPDCGLLVTRIAPGYDAASRVLKPGDVLLSYDGTPLYKPEDVRTVSEPGHHVPVEVWRDGRRDRLELAGGALGVVFDPRPARAAIAEEQKWRQVLTAARSGSEFFAPLPWTRYEVETISKLFRSDGRPDLILLGAEAAEPQLDGLAASGELKRFGVIHLATHAVIDEGVPARSAAILTQTGLPDPLEQALNNKPVFDGRLSVREIQRSWELNAELVTLSACETALGRDAGGDGFVGFTQALLMSGARSVCVSLWKVDDRATSLLMTRFYRNWMGKRPGLERPLSKAESLREAKQWLRGLTSEDAKRELNQVTRGREERSDPGSPIAMAARPFEYPFYWAGFILVGDPS